MTARLRRFLQLNTDDLLPGDFVRKRRQRGVGVVEWADDKQATVAWDKDVREVLQLTQLRKVKQRGALFDRKWRG
jgi:hypothetical protein